MTRPGTEPRSPGPLANTLTARPIYTNSLSLSVSVSIYIYKLIVYIYSSSWLDFANEDL